MSLIKKRVYNIQKTKKQRKYLRRVETPAEKILWSFLRSKQLLGCKFYRQYGIESYIIDFYCPKLKLALEADGAGHFSFSGKQSDVIRDARLDKLGIKLLRFSNVEIQEMTNEVVEVIYDFCSSIIKYKNIEEKSELEKNVQSV